MASMNIDTETGNMQTVVKDVNITLCLWANLKKNPRSVEGPATNRLSEINGIIIESVVCKWYCLKC